MFAARVSAYDGTSADIVDPSIGEMKFYRKSWGANDDVGATFQELKSEKCSQKLFNHVRLNDDEAQFFRTRRENIMDALKYTRGMLCLKDPEEF